VNRRSANRILDVEIPTSILIEKQQECHCVNLKDHEIQLEVEVQYEWYIGIIQSTESRSRHIVAGGMIERCSFPECMDMELYDRCNENEAMNRAKSGLWYDSISCICDLLKMNPDNDKARRLLNRLLKDARMGFLNE